MSRRFWPSNGLRAFLERRLTELRLKTKSRRIQKQKASMTEADARYNHDPTVSFLLQWFNRRENVPEVATRLPDGDDYETIVCEDGSTDGSLSAWDDHLTRRNDFLLRSNDLHEIRTYTRATQLARGEYVCLLQDDDTLPESMEWVEKSVALLDAHPEMALLCGQSAWGAGELDETYTFDPPDGDPLSEEEEWLVEGGFHDESDDSLPRVDPETGYPFVFTPCISVGPVFVRVSAFEDVGGFDFAFSDPGDPGMGFEVDLAIRCWLAGYRVGFTRMGFERGVGGTTIFDTEGRAEARETAWERLNRRYGDRFDELTHLVRAANRELDGRND
jgi:glycosyltransferase involved in cell wall biosynthesis